MSRVNKTIFNIPNSNESRGIMNIIALDKYDLNPFTAPFWAGKTVYHESVGFIEDKNGNVVSGTLMYKPENIISVRSHSLNLLFEEGKDFTVSGQRIILTKDSSIIPFSFDRYTPEYPSGTQPDWLVSADDPSRYIAVSKDIRNSQVMVTYTHTDQWKWYTPHSQISKLLVVFQKLKTKEDLKIVFYGDSITAGFEASGTNETVINKDNLEEMHLQFNELPYMPSWAEMVTQKLKEIYEYNNITKLNRGAGGSDSTWGKTNVSQLVNPDKPDLAVIAFGMNEPNRSGDEFKANIKSILQSIHSSSHATEFLLVSCMLPNTEAAAFRNNKLSEQEAGLYDLQREMNELHIAVAPVNKMNQEIISMGKRYTDYLGNNLNHPNDYLIRLYAQTILATLS